MLRMFLFVLCGTLLCTQALQAGGLYRWKDAEGKLHFTDTPPPAGAETVQMKENAISVVKSVPTPASHPSTNAAVRRQQEWEQGGGRSPAEQREQAEEAAKEARCERLRRQLKRMDESTHVSVNETLRYEEEYSAAGCR